MANVTAVRLAVIRATRSRLRQGWFPTRIRVDLRQAEAGMIEVTVTRNGFGIYDTCGHNKEQVRLVMQAIYSAQERLARPKPPFGPTAPT